MTRFTALCAAASLLMHAAQVQGQNTDDPSQPYTGDPDTVLLYHFDEDNGGIEPNEGPVALFGNITGGRWIPNGKFGGGLAMDGETKIDPARTSLFTSEDLTLEAWIYQSERSGEGVFLMDTTKAVEEGNVGRLLAIDVNGRPFALAVQPFEPPRLAIASAAIPLNRWVHVAALFWGSLNLVQIAVNGQIADNQFLGDELGTDRITIGQAQSIPVARGFIGRIDEVRVSKVRRFLVPVATQSRSWGAIKALY